MARESAYGTMKQQFLVTFFGMIETVEKRQDPHRKRVAVGPPQRGSHFIAIRVGTTNA